MWSIEYICSSLRSVIVASFLVIGIVEASGPPEILTQFEFIGVCQIRSTWACFDHISLIRTRNHAPFFFFGFPTH